MIMRLVCSDRVTVYLKCEGTERYSSYKIIIHLNPRSISKIRNNALDTYLGRLYFQAHTLSGAVFNDNGEDNADNVMMMMVLLAIIIVAMMVQVTAVGFRQ